jgi:hypothetical protein
MALRLRKLLVAPVTVLGQKRVATRAVFYSSYPLLLITTRTVTGGGACRGGGLASKLRSLLVAHVVVVGGSNALLGVEIEELAGCPRRSRGRFQRLTNLQFGIRCAQHCTRHRE